MTAAVGWLLPGMAASMALHELTGRGVALPAWYELLGQASPGRAWRSRDVFGDQQAVLVTFCYGDAEHAILVELLECPTPRVRRARLSASVAQLHEAAAGAAADLDGGQLLQAISLERAAAALGPAVHRSHADADADADRETRGLLPIVRRRLDRLPEPEQAGQTGYTKADRAGAVERFLAEAGTVPGADRAVVRFWAEVLAGYTATGAAAPTRVSPLWLGHILTDYVPRVFDLTPAQRAGLVPACLATRARRKFCRTVVVALPWRVETGGEHAMPTLEMTPASHPC